jgi:hypothetical protein
MNELDVPTTSIDGSDTSTPLPGDNASQSELLNSEAPLLSTALADEPLESGEGVGHTQYEGGKDNKDGPYDVVMKAELLSTVPTNQLDVIDSGASSHFARLVRGWEAYVNDGTRNVQMGLQNLNLCGEGLARLGPQGQGAGDDDVDLFAPVVLRHTHSSPLNYSRMFDDSDNPPPAAGFDHVRRSSSTPSTSAFRQRSAGSAFVANLRTMPNLTGPDDRSAFTLPMQRPTFASVSDSGVRYNSAFNPVSFQTDFEETEKTSIEVLDLGSSDNKEKKAPQKWHAASKAKKFLKDNVLLRRRRRGGRENPVGSSSVSSSLKNEEDESRTRDGADCSNLVSKPAGREVQVIATVKSLEEEVNDRMTNEHTTGFPTLRDDEEEDIIMSPQSTSQYQHLDSDVDEEYSHYQRIEAIHDSPGNVPSPVYQQFIDRGETPPTGVRLEVSARSPSQPIQTPAATSLDNPQLIRRTTSQESGAESPGTAMSTLTSNTSGHTTLATSTSGTVSSGRLTTLSTVSETDREVMETNKAGRGLRLQHVSQQRTIMEGDGDATLHSSSTASTTTHGYLALGSPAPLRDGASLLTDRFFKASTIPVAHTSSDNSGSTNSGSSSCETSGGSVTANNRVDVGSDAMERGHLTASLVLPFGENSSLMGNTESSSSTHSEDPPKFVSYLDRQLSSDTAKTLSRGNTRSSPPVLVARRNSSDERESPSQIVDYSSQVIFEAAKPDSQNVFRPVKTRDRKQSLSRPPLSPIKGLRTPPPYQRPGSTSPGYQQLSPPNIVDHRIQHSDLSKPYVLRSALPSQAGVALISPERGGASNPAVPSDGRELSEDFPISTLSQLPIVERSRTYRETSIEVEKHELSKEAPSVAVVTPEKAKGKSGT